MTRLWSGGMSADYRLREFPVRLRCRRRVQYSEPPRGEINVYILSPEVSQSCGCHRSCCCVRACGLTVSFALRCCTEPGQGADRHNHRLLPGRARSQTEVRGPGGASGPKQELRHDGEG